MASYWSIILPEAATNLILNPSFESGTTGWGIEGTNTLAQSTAAAKFGAYSAKLVYKDDTTLATYGITLTASTTYHLSCWVYVPTGWDGGNIQISGVDYADAVYTYNTIYTEGTSTEGIWVYLETKMVLSADAVGSITIVTSGAPTVDKFIYLDALQAEANASYATTYIDGYQPGCSGAISTKNIISTRDAQSRAGGRVYDVEDYGLYVAELTGFGVAPITQHVHKQSLLPGDAYKGYGVRTRQFALVSDLIGTSWTDLHSKRQALIDAIKPDKVKGAQPFLLRYTGARSDNPLEIECVYQEGLGFGRTSGFTERLGIRIKAYDPFFYEVGNDVTHLTLGDTVAMKYVIGKIDGAWDGLGPPSAVTDPGAGIYIYAIEADDDYFYVGGSFLNWDGDADADYMAYYDKAAGTWSPLGGTALGGQVNYILKSSDGDIYIGGAFTDAGGDGDADYVAKWNGSAFSALAAGGVSQVYCLAFGLDGTLYIGGSFSNWGDANGDYIVSWDGSSYSSLGTGLNGNCYAMAIHPFTGALYVSGAFTTAGGGGANRIAKWNGTSWSALGAGMDSTVFGLTFDDSGNLYAAGAFGTADGVTCIRIAKWNGATFEPLAGGLNNTVASLWHKDGYIYASGSFTASGDIDLADKVAVWNGSTWSHLDVDLPGPPIFYYRGLIFDGEDMYFGAEDALGNATTSYSNTVTNNGTTKAYPKLVIKRLGGTSVTLKWIKNEDTGATIWFNYSLLDEESLTLDLTHNNRTCKSNYFNNVWRAVLRSSDLIEFNLLPGNNNISLMVEEVGGPTTTCYMTWRNTHWSSDGVA